MSNRKWIVISFVMLAMLLGSVGKVASQGSGPDGSLERLQQLTGGSLVSAYHSETGMLRFVGSDPQHPIPVSADLASSAAPEMTARAFLQEYGSLFGVRDQASELKLMRQTTTDGEGNSVRFQQLYQGIPVLAGEIIVQENTSKQILSASGELLPGIAVSITPRITADAARQTALQSVAKVYEIPVEGLTASEPELWIYNPALLGGTGPQLNLLVWRLQVTPTDLLPVRELVLVDAQAGKVALHFNQVDTAKSRRTYVANGYGSASLPGTLARSEGQADGSDAEVNAAHNFAGDTYDFYYTVHGRDGIDNHGMDIISSVRYCPNASSCPYANAFWNSVQMVYGATYASADDVVAHELSHGVTEHESGLFYYMQSGAINEAFSDIWGEFVDQANGDSGPRWLMGEDLPIGAIRSMSNPPQFGQPDAMTSPYWECDEGDGDQGGVHTNSGVANKVAYLMVDGGSFNGQTGIVPMGRDKTAKIFYYAQVNSMTSGSDYGDLYNNLMQACTNLTGSGVTTAADCQNVKKALDAVAMNQQGSACAAPEAPVCTTGVPTDLFNDNLENTSSGKWVTGAIAGNNFWFYPATPNSINFDANYATSGVQNFWGFPDETASNDEFIAMNSNIAVPAGKTVYMRFNHAYAFEYSGGNAWDGGVVEYSINNGSSWVDASTLIVNNGYDTTLASGNPMAGRQAFTGRSFGYQSTRLDLSSLGGKNVRFRFRIGADSSTDYSYGYWVGWFIDDVRVYTCGAAPVYNNRLYLPVISKPGHASVPTATPTITPTPIATPPSPGPASINSSADATVLQGYSGMNAGDTVDMWAGYDDYLNPDGMTVRSLVWFDTTGITGKSITSAKLKLYLVGSYDYPNKYRTITPYAVTAPWAEGTVNWNNAPAAGTSYGSASILSSAWGWKEFDVTALAQGWANGTIANYGIMLRGPEVSGADSSWRSFSTKEGDYIPVIVFTYAGMAASESPLYQSGLGYSSTILDLFGSGLFGPQLQCAADQRCFTSE